MMERSISYKKGFIPYASAALLIGLVGGFSTVLGPAFVQDFGIAYNNTTWTALAQAMSTAACAPILGKMGDAIGRRKAKGNIRQSFQSLHHMGIITIGKNTACCQLCKLTEGFLHILQVLKIVQMVCVHICDHSPSRGKIQEGIAVFTAFQYNGITIADTVAGL